nr:hypothetical protein [Candidatus Enterousia merdequi]
MKIYNTNIRYFCPSKMRCFVSRNGSVKISSFDKVMKCQMVFNLSKQKAR